MERNNDDNGSAENILLQKSRFPQAFLENTDIEMPIPEGRPDVIVDPFNFHEEVRNEDHRYHRLPIGVLSGIDNRVLNVNEAIEEDIESIGGVLAHGDGIVEGLLFPGLYPNGRGYWQYQRSIIGPLARDPTYIY